MSVASFTVWVSCFIVARSFPILNDSPRVGPAVTFWIYSAISLLAFVMVFRMVPETKGRSLEEIEGYWEGLVRNAAMTPRNDSVNSIEIIKIWDSRHSWNPPSRRSPALRVASAPHRSAGSFPPGRPRGGFVLQISIAHRARWSKLPGLADRGDPGRSAALSHQERPEARSAEA